MKAKHKSMRTIPGANLRRISMRLAREANELAPEAVAEIAERQLVVQTMTNWQRNQWARAGFYTNDLEEIRRFSSMERHPRGVIAL